MSGESNSASMSGLRDPLLTYFMEESAAKEVKLTQQKRLISKLQLELTASRAQYASIWSVQDRLLERIRMYQSMLRRSRDRVITLEERIAMFTGSSHPNFIVVDSDDDSDTMSLTADGPDGN